MTVGGLKKLLEEYDDDTEVLVEMSAPYEGQQFTCTNITIEDGLAFGAPDPLPPSDARCIRIVGHL